MQAIYLGYLYNRYRKLKGMNINDPPENTGQMQSNYKEWSESSQQQLKKIVLIVYIILRY